MLNCTGANFNASDIDETKEKLAMDHEAHEKFILTLLEK